MLEMGRLILFIDMKKFCQRIFKLHRMTIYTRSAQRAKKKEGMKSSSFGFYNGLLGCKLWRHHVHFCKKHCKRLSKHLEAIVKPLNINLFIRQWTNSSWKRLCYNSWKTKIGYQQSRFKSTLLYIVLSIGKKGLPKMSNQFAKS